jgi:hypothetical protein
MVGARLHHLLQYFLAAQGSEACPVLQTYVAGDHNQFVFGLAL